MIVAMFEGITGNFNLGPIYIYYQKVDDKLVKIFYQYVFTLPGTITTACATGCAVFTESPLAIGAALITLFVLVAFDLSHRAKTKNMDKPASYASYAPYVENQPVPIARDDTMNCFLNSFIWLLIHSQLLNKVKEFSDKKDPFISSLQKIIDEYENAKNLSKAENRTYIISSTLITDFRNTISKSLDLGEQDDPMALLQALLVKLNVKLPIKRIVNQPNQDNIEQKRDNEVCRWIDLNLLPHKGRQKVEFNSLIEEFLGYVTDENQLIHLEFDSAPDNLFFDCKRTYQENDHKTGVISERRKITTELVFPSKKFIVLIDKSDNCEIYRPTVFLKHGGEIDYGHWTAYVKTVTSTGKIQWWHCNDNIVQKIEEEKVDNALKTSEIFYFEKGDISSLTGS
ncbi:MAG: ubiquitin carboxyl-terminal hydrolase [Chlamydiae bacterium]|nr:ubiquitin carboxyl-terminal hydrolase [Chlamydiota bacterium]